MKYDPGHRSNDVEDRRGQPNIGGSAGLLFWIGSRFGLPGVLVAVGVMAVVYFVSRSDEPNDQSSAFVSSVLDDVQQTWTDVFAREGRSYRHARLVLYTDATDTACGFGTAATGPFYCPGDEQIYLDLGFFQELDQRLGAPGDFAQAYVVAHEVGHHVQKLLGLRAPRSEGATGGSVRTELQADCYAGVWAHSSQQRDLLEQGDIEEAIRAATAIGDDRLQRQSTGTVQPEQWTHGSSAERSRWFRVGLASGLPASCDTFAADQL